MTKNRVPSSAAVSRKPADPAATNGRTRRSAAGSIGSAVRRSCTTRTAPSTTPAASAPSTSGAAQPISGPRTTPHTTPSSAAAVSRAPTGSSRRAAPRLSGRRTIASGTSTTPIGTLIQKIHCHDRPCVTAPPTSGPASTASPVTPVKTPVARPRRAAGKVAPSIAMASGSTAAAPTPCSARPAINHPAVGASAHAAEASVNRANPAVNTRRRPQRSPIAAAVTISTANGRL